MKSNLMSNNMRELSFTISRLSALSLSGDLALSTASLERAEPSEYQAKDGIGVLLLVGPDGILRVHVVRDAHGQPPVAGARVRMANTEGDEMGSDIAEMNRATTDTNGEAVLGRVDALSRPAAAPYRLIVTVPLGYE
jgi:hypothetical protein